jgi:hydrogenase nickel incorporation protein HypA/HybF
MHEMALCEGLIQLIEPEAQRHAVRAVRRVRLEIGRFAGIEIAALRFGFDIVTKGSLAEGATLDIIELPGRAYCFDCAETVDLDDRLAPCPLCGGARLAPTGGDDMRLKDLEVV